MDGSHDYCQVVHGGPIGLTDQRGHGQMNSKQQQKKQYIYLFIYSIKMDSRSKNGKTRH